LKPELEAGNPQVKVEKPIATHEVSELDISPASVSKNQNQGLGSVEDTLIPKDEVPRQLRWKPRMLLTALWFSIYREVSEPQSPGRVFL
jgi:hypothetical protein